MPNDGIRLKIILIIEVRKLEFTDFDSHSPIKNSKYQTLNIQNLSDKYIVLEQEKTALMQEYSSQNSMLHKLQQAKKNTDLYLDNHLEK